jgi:hypothetical protein
MFFGIPGIPWNSWEFQEFLEFHEIPEFGGILFASIILSTGE